MSFSDVLIVSSAEKAVETLRAALREQGAGEADAAACGAEARRALSACEPRLVLVNAPLRDEFGHELALFAAEKTSAGIVLLVKAELFDSAAARVEDAGVFVVSKPINRALMGRAVRMALAVNSRIMGVRRQNTLLQKKVEEIRLVDRAKCALIQYRQWTEPEAHRFIEQTAMETRRTRAEVARELLLRYEGET